MEIFFQRCQVLNCQKRQLDLVCNKANVSKFGKLSVPFSASRVIKILQLLINGAFVDALSGKTFQVLDPRSEEVIFELAEADKGDVDR